MDSQSNIDTRNLTERDFDLVNKFIQTQAQSVASDVFYPPSGIIIEKCLHKDSGLSRGAFDKDQLIGVRLTYKPKLNLENHGYALKYSVTQLNELAQFHGTLISEEKRYRGIGSRLVMENVSEIFKGYSSIILVTVHPENESSIRMLEKNGFVKKLLTFAYTNLPRLIYQKLKE